MGYASQGVTKGMWELLARLTVSHQWGERMAILCLASNIGFLNEDQWLMPDSEPFRNARKGKTNDRGEEKEKGPRGGEFKQG